MQSTQSAILEKVNIRHGFIKKNTIDNLFEMNFTRDDYDKRKNSYNALESNINSEILGINQIHSNKILTVNNVNHFSVLQNNYNIEKLPKADGLISEIKGTTIVIQAADCVPVLIINKNKTIIAGIHSGWRGTLSGINQEMIAKLEDMGYLAKDLIIILGPSIMQKSYEVDKDFMQDFIKKDASSVIYFNPSEEKKDKYYFNNSEYMHKIFENLGVGIIENIDIDTYANEDFYSHRAYKRGIKAQGMNVSFICLD